MCTLAAAGRARASPRGPLGRATSPKPISRHTLRRSLATHLHGAGYDLRSIQERLDHRQVTTTMMYTHVRNKGGLGVRSPLDTIDSL